MRTKIFRMTDIPAFLKITAGAAAVIMTLNLCMTALKDIKPGKTDGNIINAANEEHQTPEAQEEYKIPDDIKDIEREYIKNYKDRETGGEVKEVFFQKCGATDFTDGIAIKNASKSKKPDFSALLSMGADFAVKDKSEPLVLIYHTHTSESYLMADTGKFYKDYETRSNDENKNVVRVGSEICRVLEENGIGCIHDKTIYDKVYTGAYSVSRKGIEKILEENPSIIITADIHRDAVYYSETSRAKPTAEINSMKAAQIMLLTGTEEPPVESFPEWEKNLRFALELQKTAETMYPGLMKPLFFCPRKYNTDITENSLLIEVGTDANSLREAVYSGHLLGQVLSEMINSHVKEE